MAEDRHSHALEAELISDPAEKALREAQNGLKQMAQVVEMIEYHLDPERPFRFRPSHLLTLQRAALLGLPATPVTGVQAASRSRGAGIRLQMLTAFPS